MVVITNFGFFIAYNDLCTLSLPARVMPTVIQIVLPQSEQYVLSQVSQGSKTAASPIYCMVCITANVIENPTP
jgi:hypothetical protein